MSWELGFMLMLVSLLLSLEAVLTRTAFGGFAGLGPGMSHLTKGMDKAHSLTLDGPSLLPFLITTDDTRSQMAECKYTPFSD